MTQEAKIVLAFEEIATDIKALQASGGSPFSILELTQGTMQQHDAIADLSIEWKTLDTADANFEHSVSTNSEQIKCLTQGWVDCRYMVQWDQDDSARLTTKAYITKNGTTVAKSNSNRPYFRGLNYARYGSSGAGFYFQVDVNDILVLHTEVADTGAFGQLRNIDTMPAETFIQLCFKGS